MEPTPLNPRNEHTYHIRVPELLVAIVRETFVMLFCTYLAAMVIDALADSFVSNVLDTDVLLRPLLAVGVLAVLMHPLVDPAGHRSPSRGSRVTFAVVAGIVAAAVVWAKVRSIGSFGPVYALVSGVIVATLAFQSLSEEEPTDHSNP